MYYLVDDFNEKQYDAGKQTHKQQAATANRKDGVFRSLSKAGLLRNLCGKVVLGNLATV